MKKNMIIYRDSLLVSSETFILNQAKNLTQFNPYFMGYKKAVNSLDSGKIPMILNNYEPSNRNKISEVIFKKIGFNPKLYLQAKKINPSLVHAHFGPDGVLALPLTKKLQVPLVVTFHGYDVTVKDSYHAKASFNVRHYIKNKNKLIENGDLFIAVSNFIKDKLIEKGFPEEKIVTHYIGVDLNQLSVDPSIKRKDVILFVGRLVSNKGGQYLIDAMDYVFEKCPTAELWLIGDGPDKDMLMKKAEKHGEKIKFLGRQPYDEVIRTMNMAKVFSVPSVEIESGASEAFGMVFAEANAMGLPVASFKTGGIPEAVIHEETGLLVEPKDVKGLAQSIVELMNNDALREEMSRNGIQRVQRDLDIAKQTRKLEDIYNDLLK